MLSTKKWPHSLSIAVAACSTALVCALALSWARHGTGEQREDGAGGARGGSKSRERGRSHAAIDAVPAVLRPHDARAEEEEEHEDEKCKERARGGAADRKGLEEGKKAVIEAKAQPARTMSLEVSKQQRPLGMEPVGCLGGGFFGSATSGPAAGVWQTSPNFRNAGRAQAAMSANEKRDLDNMFKHQGRQGGRAVYAFELARAKQARLRKHQRKGAAATSDLAISDSGTLGGATQDGDSELPVEQDLVLLVESLESVTSATQTAPKKARKKRRRPARAAPASHELEEEDGQSGERQEELLQEEEEDECEESVAMAEVAAEVVEDDDTPVDVQDGDEEGALAEAEPDCSDAAEDEEEVADGDVSGGEDEPLVDDFGGTPGDGTPEGGEQSHVPSVAGDEAEELTSEAGAEPADAQDDSNPAAAPLTPSNADVEASTSQEVPMETGDAQRSSSMPSSPPKPGGEDPPAKVTCDAAVQTVEVSASEVEISGRDTQQRRLAGRSMDPELASTQRRARAWADLTDTSDDNDEPGGCGLTPAVAAIIEKAVLPCATPPARGHHSESLRSNRVPVPSPPSPEAVDVSSDQPGHDAVEPSQAAPEPEDTPEPTTLRKPGSCEAGGLEAATAPGPRGGGGAGARTGKPVAQEKSKAPAPAAGTTTREAPGDALETRRARGRGAGAAGTRSRTNRTGADDGWEMVLPKAKKKGRR